MKKLIISASLTVVLTALAGCISEPIATNKARPVPAKRVFAPAAMLRTCAGCGVLIVKRDTISIPTPIAHISINKTHIADIDNGEKIKIYLAPGDYVLSATKGGLLANPATEVTIRAAQTKIGSSPDWVGSLSCGA